MNKQQLASKIWQSANNMRSKIEANEYKDYILGFIFYKFLSDKEEEVYIKDNGSREGIEDLKEDDLDYVKFFQDKIGYFISYDNLFSTWLAKDKDFDVSNVSDALHAFNRLIADQYKKVYEKIFDTLQTGLSKLGDSSGAQTKAIRGLIHLIKDIPMDDKQGYDVLGFIYEYLISMFAANAGKKAGEFYTPHEVSLLMSEIVASHLKDRDKIDIYDPTSGSGSLLINIGKSVSKYMKDKNHIKYYAQELKENTYSLTRMNLVMRGILPANIVARNGDTLEDDWPYFEENDKENTYQALYVDAVVSNPPYSQKRDPSERDNDPRFVNYGTAPKAKADYAFLLHDLYHLKDDGIMTIVLPHGVLFRGGEEEKIRTNLIENNNIDTIIGLPANIFFGTSIPTIIMVLRKDRQPSDVLIIDASKGFEKVGKSNKLRSSDIKKIIDVYLSRESIPGFSKNVTRQEIRDNTYNLNIPRYVDSSEKPATWDIYSNMYGGIPNHEIEELKEYWDAFPNLKNELFTKIDGHTSKVNSDDYKSIILNNTDVRTYKQKFSEAFRTFDSYLKSELVDNLSNVKVNGEEAKITDDIFKRLVSIPLVDKYTAYQLFDDRWNTISTDLEIIETEGFNSIKQVDPNMVTKKKDGKEVEVQEGYVGHILPFDLVQEVKLSAELKEIDELNQKLEAETELREELAEELSEDDKSSSIFDDEKNEFISKEITKEAKSLKKRRVAELDVLESIILKVDTSFNNEKALKKELKTKNAQLLEKTREIIEQLEDHECLSLLEKKWITPVCDAINKLPDIVVNDLISKVKKLSKKYEDTLLSLDEEITNTEKELSTLLDDLEADEFDKKGLEEFKKLLGGDF